jgi:hypothetical protein
MMRTGSKIDELLTEVELACLDLESSDDFSALIQDATQSVESDWLTAAGPRDALQILERQGVLVLPPSTRKLRLFACALVRSRSDQLRDSRVADALVAGEALAAGDISPELAAAHGRLAHQADNEAGASGSPPAMLCAMACNPQLNGTRSNFRAAVIFAEALGVTDAEQVAMLRCLFCNPFRAERMDDIAFLRSSAGCIALGKALEISRSRRHGDLPQLVSALESAGLRGTELLRHLRGQQRCALCLGAARAEPTDLPCSQCRGGWLTLPTLHVQGCWALDELLGL